MVEGESKAFWMIVATVFAAAAVALATVTPPPPPFAPPPPPFASPPPPFAPPPPPFASPPPPFAPPPPPFAPPPPPPPFASPPPPPPFASPPPPPPFAPPPPPSAQQRCYFVFGDSVFDNGNNNALTTTAKVNYLPYGIDFAQGPTGRFCNGRNIPDVIAQLSGFSNFIPPFAGASPAQANIGLNYASGGGGIRDDSSQNLGERISLREQVDNHWTAIIRAAVPTTKLKKCLYTISIGSNDYLNNYFLPQSLTRRLYTPDQYARSLISFYRIYLKKLYILGARNVALFGIGKIGCTPRIIASLGGGTGCAEEVNQAVILFNNYLIDLIADLNEDLFGAKFTYVDFFSGNASDFAAFGLTVFDTSCCTVNPGEELCAANGPVCPDRTKYIFWDNVHTTEIINVLVANAAFNGVNTSPYSISQLLI